MSFKRVRENNSENDSGKSVASLERKLRVPKILSQMDRGRVENFS